MDESELVNYSEANKKDIVINSAARSGEAVEKFGGTLIGSLDELHRQLISFWVINRQRDSIELLKKYMDVVPGELHVVHEELSRKSDLIRSSYSLQKDGFYRVSIQTEELKNFFRNNDFNALSFTDSRSKYQFYNLARLWSDIYIGLEHDLLLLNICTPPVSAKKVYECITGDSNWNNELDKTPFDYDMRTIHADKFRSAGMYLCSQENELNDILSFMKAWSG